MKPHKFIIILSLLLLPACGARFSSISRNHDFNHGTSNIIDAKQRGIISVTREENSPTKHIICAEPSPDALTALASSSEIDGGDGKIKATLATALRESAGSIGLRTQTIQILRDDKYRLCEAYANGAIDDIEYGSLLRQSQKNMLALLATEQLTGAISAPAITLNSGVTSVEPTQGNGTAGSKLNEIAVITQNTPPKDIAQVAKSVACIVNTMNKKDDNISFCMMQYQRAVRDGKDEKMIETIGKLCYKVVEKELLGQNNISDISCQQSASLSSSTSEDPLGGVIQ